MATPQALSRRPSTPHQRLAPFVTGPHLGISFGDTHNENSNYLRRSLIDPKTLPSCQWMSTESMVLAREACTGTPETDAEALTRHSAYKRGSLRTSTTMAAPWRGGLLNMGRITCARPSAETWQHLELREAVRRNSMLQARGCVEDTAKCVADVLTGRMLACLS